jgi:pimeloyl-ACP methyl ester carboxylesterase
MWEISTVTPSERQHLDYILKESRSLGYPERDIIASILEAAFPLQLNDDDVNQYFLENGLHPSQPPFQIPKGVNFGSNQNVRTELHTTYPNYSRQPVPPTSQINAKVVCPLHGIRTHAEWQRTFSDVAHQHNIYCPLDKWSFGRFSLIRFLLPWQREAKIRWFRSTYDDLMDSRAAALGGNNRPSVVAHSFGTYILGYALLKYKNIRLDKIILCGSILPRNFPWQEIIERGQVRALRNEYGVKDVWVKFVRWLVKGSGSSGQNGFTQNGFKLKSDEIIQEEFIFEHSEYFNRGHMEEFWIPFLLTPSHPVVCSNTQKSVSLPSSSPPFVLYFLYAVILLGMVFAPFRFLPGLANSDLNVAWIFSHFAAPPSSVTGPPPPPPAPTNCADTPGAKICNALSGHHVLDVLVDRPNAVWVLASEPAPGPTIINPSGAEYPTRKVSLIKIRSLQELTVTDVTQKSNITDAALIFFHENHVNVFLVYRVGDVTQYMNAGSLYTFNKDPVYELGVRTIFSYQNWGAFPMFINGHLKYFSYDGYYWVIDDQLGGKVTPREAHAEWEAQQAQKSLGLFPAKNHDALVAGIVDVIEKDIH